MRAQILAAGKRWRSDDDEVRGEEGKRDSLSRCFRALLHTPRNDHFTSKTTH